MKKLIGLALLVLAPSPFLAAQTAPTVDQILSLKRAGSPEISPDGRMVAYTVRETNWDENAFETQIWMADVASGSTYRLTNAKKSSQSPAWKPDGSQLAFVSDRTDKRQIYLIDPRGGEAQPLTALDDGVGSFAWSPDGKSIAYTATEPKSAAIKERDKKYGEFQIVEQDYRMSHLFVIDVATRATKRLAGGGTFTVGSFQWSPDSTQIAFDHRANPSPGSSGTADISIVSVADAAIRPLVTDEAPETSPFWSPDGTRIAFETTTARPVYSYMNRVIATVPSTGGAPTVLTAAFDEDPNIVAWKADGIFFSANQKALAQLYRVNVTTKVINQLSPSDAAVYSNFSLTPDAKSCAYLRADWRTMADVYVNTLGTDPSSLPSKRFDPPMRGKKLTDMNAQTSGWVTSSLEVVSWKSQDGTTIEGVLHKPAGFNPSQKYPLLVVIHGGPTGVSRAIPFTSATYPIDVWVPRGVLVLEPNYRGSAGYGEKFRSLNVRNLGIGDAWDVLSGIDSLIAKGFVDPAKVGTMGWSQGGYISAFLATHDAARFKAISVGAGISDWMTYYVNTDIHPFTRHYLKATPWEDPDIYAKTSPITYIKQAKTPTLIQHGATDQRVPLPNAFELYQGLLDNKVPAKLIVYQGFGGIGHGPSKPKSYRATMEHNLEWFDQYLFQTAAKPTTEQQR